jgi:hypothetical protein
MRRTAKACSADQRCGGLVVHGAGTEIPEMHGLAIVPPSNPVAELTAGAQ